MPSSRFERHPALTVSAVSIVGAILLLLAFEGLVRWFAPAINFRSSDARLIVPRTFFDTHGNAPNFNGEVFGIRVHTDANGFRTDPAAPHSDFARPAVLFLGDSVTFGVGVSDGKTFVDLVRANAAPTRVINASSIGYSLESYGNVVRAFILPVRERMQIGKVVLAVCLNDVNWTKAPEFSVNGKKAGAVPAAEPSSDPATRYGAIAVWFNETFPSVNWYLSSHSKLFLLLRGLALDSGRAHLDAAMAAYEHPQTLKQSLDALGTIAMELRRAGIGLDVLLLPFEYQLRANAPQTYLPQRLLGQFMDAQKIRYFDAAQEFRADMAAKRTKAADYYLFDDPMHLSELGHAVVYRFIARSGIALP